MQVYAFFIFLFIAAKMISSFNGEKTWEFVQILTQITMELLRQN